MKPPKKTKWNVPFEPREFKKGETVLIEAKIVDLERCDYKGQWQRVIVRVHTSGDMIANNNTLIFAPAFTNYIHRPTELKAIREKRTPKEKKA